MHPPFLDTRPAMREFHAKPSRGILDLSLQRPSHLAHPEALLSRSHRCLQDTSGAVFAKTYAPVLYAEQIGIPLAFLLYRAAGPRIAKPRSNVGCCMEVRRSPRVLRRIPIARLHDLHPTGRSVCSFAGRLVQCLPSLEEVLSFLCCAWAFLLVLSPWPLGPTFGATR